MPKILLLANWSMHVEILNKCKLPEQKIFYILYVHKERLNYRELQRAIKTNAYSSLLTDQNGHTVSALLLWSHYERLIRVENESARNWYLKEAATNNWMERTIDRTISTLYYQRLLSSQTKESVVSEMNERTAAFQNDAFEFTRSLIIFLL